MQIQTFSIRIDAPRERVWQTMLDDATYRQWTKAFSDTSYYEGRWEAGSDMRFLDGSGNGMLSRIAAIRRPEFVSIEHRGMIKDGREDTVSAEVKQWAGAHENYTLTEIEGGTEVRVDMDIDEKHVAMFADLWPKALQRLKSLAEGK